MTILTAYKAAQKKAPFPHLIQAVDFGDAYGFLFSPNKGQQIFGGSFIMVPKNGQKLFLLPTVPDNVNRINSGESIDISSFMK